MIRSLKEYRKRNGSGAVYDDPRVAVGAGRFDEVGAAAEAGGHHGRGTQRGSRAARGALVP